MTDKTTISRSPASIYIACFCLAIGSLMAIFYYPFTLEDAYITFHYSRTFAEGLGIGVWNASQPPVEGFSSFSWMLIIGMAEKLGLSPFVVSKVLGFASYLFISVLFLVASIRHSPDENPVSVDISLPLSLAAIISSLYLPLAWYSVSGMEVTFFCCQVTASLLTPLIFRSSSSRAVWASLVSIAIVLTRPEGILIALLTNSYWFYFYRKQHRSRLWSVLGIAFAILAFVILTGYRVHHFGELVPNTYFAKATGGALSHRLRIGVRYTSHFLFGVTPFFIIFCLGVVVIGRKIVNNSMLGFLVFFFALYAIYIVKVGGDPEYAFSFWRQFAHIAPVWILYLTLTLCFLVPSNKKAIGCALVLVFLTDASILISHREILAERPRQFLAKYGVLKLEPQNQFFSWLRQYETPQTLSAVCLAGQWAYLVPGRYIDSLGLNDRYIAKHGHVEAASSLVDSKTDMAYVLAQKPDIIDGYISGNDLVAGRCPLTTRGIDRSQMVWDMKTDPEFKDNYLFVANAPYKQLDRALFVRKDFAAAFRLQLKTVLATETSLYRSDCPTSLGAKR